MLIKHWINIDSTLKINVESTFGFQRWYKFSKSNIISDDNGSAILEVGICHIEGRSSYFLPQKGTIIYFQWAKERECIDFNLNFLIDAFLTFLFMICCQKYISKVTNFCLPVKIVSAILNDQVGSHMLNHLIFMFWWRSTRSCVPHCKEETWLNRLVWNLSRLIFSIKSSCLAEIGQLWHYFHENQQHFEDSRGCLSEE